MHILRWIPTVAFLAATTPVTIFGQAFQPVSREVARKATQDGNIEWGKARVAIDRNTFEKMLARDLYVQFSDRRLTRQQFIDRITLCPAGETVPTTRAKHVAINYAKSSFADFLFYLFYRNVGRFPALKSHVPLEDIPPLSEGSFLPDDSASSGVSSYGELYRLASTYDERVRLTKLLKDGEPHYAKFSDFWQKQIAPTEDDVIKAWKQEDAEWSPIVHLEQMERLTFPFSSIKIEMLALDPQGSSMQGPPTIFTTIQVPSLSWAIGHEGTHMMIGEKGADWKNRKNGDLAIRAMVANGGSDYDVEEALCLLMQAKLSIGSGRTSKEYLSSKEFTKESPRKTLLLALEGDWPAYLASANTNIADFLIEETIKTFSGH